MGQMQNQERLNESAGAALDLALMDELQQLERAGLHRSLRQFGARQGPRVCVGGREILMLAGANYLDLAADPRVAQAATEAGQEYGCAAGGARLIGGNLALHEQLEHDLAHFLQKEAALLFSTGYMANLGVLTALAGSSDVIVSDALNHASIIDACRLSRAETRTYRHNDAHDFGRVARSLAGYRRRLLVVDGLFSMDGDLAALRELVPIAREHEMIIVVDDAHGFGVLGREGRGTVEELDVECDVIIGNLGKALGSFGAFAACSATVREYLVNCCRPFIFTCGLPAATVAAARAALSILQQEPRRRRDLRERGRQLRAGLQDSGYETGASTTHIVPAILGDNELAREFSEQALQQDVFVQAIRYPSVPRRTARLRFSPMASHRTEEIQSVVELFSGLRRRQLDRRPAAT